MTPFIAPDGTRFAKATGVAIQPDGRILAAGDAFINCPGLGCADFALARYTDNGELDPEFGGGGTKTLGIGADNDFAYGVALQTTPSAALRRGPGDERLLVAGASGNSGDTIDLDAAVGVQLRGGTDCSGLTAEKFAQATHLVRARGPPLARGRHRTSTTGGSSSRSISQRRAPAA